jgi:geranylgeranyl diphosphate synthase type II
MTPRAPDVPGYLRDRRLEIDAALETILPAPPRCPDTLSQAMQYSLSAGGKRLRPILCLAGADAVGGDRSLAMPAACAIELIHTYSLIHDDLPAMDDDTLRRGKPTLHVVAGEGMAILAGDGLLTEAFHLLAREPRSRHPDVVERKLRVIACIAEAAGALGMVGGQAIDLLNAGPDPREESATSRAPSPEPRVENEPRAPSPESRRLDAQGLARMHAMKTGALIRAAATSGAIMAGGEERQIEAIDRAATELGLAFQIVDDILDIEGGADLGKTTGKDAAAGKLTYPALYGIEESKRLAAACLARAETALADGSITDPHLLAIGAWIVERRN